MTTTVCVQVLELPPRSTTVHVTMLVPTAKDDGALLVTLPTPQLSDVTGVPSATLAALHWPASAKTVTATGQLIVGISLSTIVTNCVQVALLP